MLHVTAFRMHCIWQFSVISVKLYFFLFVVLFVDCILGSKTSSCLLQLLPVYLFSECLCTLPFHLNKINFCSWYKILQEILNIFSVNDCFEPTVVTANHLRPVLSCIRQASLCIILFIRTLAIIGLRSLHEQAGSPWAMKPVSRVYP